MLSTYVLNPISINDNVVFESLDINPKGYNVSTTLFASLRSAIECSINYDDDVIYCVCDNKGLNELDLNMLENVLHDVIPESIFALYVHAKYNDSVQVNENCKVIFDIEKVSSFILTRPVYRLALALIEQWEEKKLAMNWIGFLSLLIPHFFLVCDNNSKTHLNPENLKLTKFHIIAPFRNALSYIKNCLDSVKKQEYARYHIYFVDDASVDSSSSAIPNGRFITTRINKTRKYALQNILDVLLENSISEEDIVCLLDADDKLSHKYVFTILNNLYQQDSLLLTYGSMRVLNNNGIYGNVYSQEEFKVIRNSPWKAVHLRTFRYKVFKEFIRQDPGLKLLRDAKGQILKMPYDMALLFPLMELVGYENTKFIPAVLYEYRLHEDNDHTRYRKKQLEGEKEIRAKKGLKRFF